MTDPNPRPKWDFHNPHSQYGQVFVKYTRRLYHPLGFHKGYNFPLFLIGLGGLMGFALARFEYFNMTGIFFKKAIPGEVFWYGEGARRIGITMHLAGVLPAAFLVGFQFVPIIRYKVILFHRLNGYACILLLIVGNAGAFMVIDHAVGGNVGVQVWIGLLGIMTTVGLFLAWFNIKRLQIDQHRAWMLRTWTYAACIISLRIIQLAANDVIRNYYPHTSVVIRCDEIFWMYSSIAGIPDSQNPTSKLYPQCAQGPGWTHVAVTAVGPGPENSGALARLTFNLSGWVALFIHAVLVEMYLWLTPAESYRLRQVSYERQVKAGLRVSGSIKDAGLTATRLGDAPEWWSKPVPKADLEQQNSQQSSLLAPAVRDEPKRFNGDDENETDLGGAAQGSRLQTQPNTTMRTHNRDSPTRHDVADGERFRHGSNTSEATQVEN